MIKYKIISMSNYTLHNLASAYLSQLISQTLPNTTPQPLVSSVSHIYSF